MDGICFNSNLLIIRENHDINRMKMAQKYIILSLIKVKKLHFNLRNYVQICRYTYIYRCLKKFNEIAFEILI